MRFSYKPIVERFKIPRPTLIDWNKRAKKEPENWRGRHLKYLQESLFLEKETLLELSDKGIGYKDIFIIATSLYFNPQKTFIDKKEYKNLLKKFSFQKNNSIEYRHEFAKEIWDIPLDDGSGRFIADYPRVFALLDTLSVFQYYTLYKLIADYLEELRKKIDFAGHSNGIEGRTWQELYSLQKAFSKKSIETKFSSIL